MPAIIQDRYTQLNLDVPYHVAESLARRFSGAGAQTAAIMFEIKAVVPSLYLATLCVASEIRLFGATHDATLETIRTCRKRT